MNSTWPGTSFGNGRPIHSRPIGQRIGEPPQARRLGRAPTTPCGSRPASSCIFVSATPRCDELMDVVEDLVLGEVRRGVAHREVRVVVDDREPVRRDPLVVADPRRQELVVDRRVRELADDPAGVDQTSADVGVVAVEEDVLVEPARLEQPVPAVDLVGALQVGELEGPWEAVVGELVLAPHGSTQPIRGAVAVLEPQPGVVEHDAAGAGDLRDRRTPGVPASATPALAAHRRR